LCSFFSAFLDFFSLLSFLTSQNLNFYSAALSNFNFKNHPPEEEEEDSSSRYTRKRAHTHARKDISPFLLIGGARRTKERRALFSKFVRGS